MAEPVEHTEESLFEAPPLAEQERMIEALKAQAKDEQNRISRDSFRHRRADDPARDRGASAASL